MVHSSSQLAPCVLGSCLLWQKRRWRRRPSSWLSRLWFRSESTRLPPAGPVLMLHLHRCRFLIATKHNKNTSLAHFIPHTVEITDVTVNTTTLWIYRSCVRLPLRFSELTEMQSCLPGSLRAKQPTFSPVVKGVIHCFFCSSVPNFRIGPRYSDWKQIFAKYVVNSAA